MADSVSLEDEATASKGGGSLGSFGWRQGLLLFVVLLFVFSDIFTNNLVNYFPGAVEGRDVTEGGKIMLCALSVILYSLVLYLCDKGIL